MEYFVRYGAGNETIDITIQLKKNTSVSSKYLFVPPLDDVSRGETYGDPKYGIEKVIFILTNKGHLFVVKSGEYAYIDIEDEALYLNEKPDDIE